MAQHAVMHLIRLAGTRADAPIARAARRCGTPSAAFNALAVIEGAAGPLPVGEITTWMPITTATMTSVLDTLERRGYVRHRHDQSGRRRALVDITPDAHVLRT